SVDLRMRRSLADSLAYIAGEISGRIEFDGDALGRLIANLSVGERYSPQVFALYTRLVLALGQGDLTLARDILAQLVAETPQPCPWRLYALDDTELLGCR